MKKEKIFFISTTILSVLFFLIMESPFRTFAMAQEKASGSEQILELYLDDCILRAINNNLGLRAEMLTPEIAEGNVLLAKEKFLPSFSINFRDDNQRSASYSFLEAKDVVTKKQNDYTFQLSQNIPFGGSFSLSLYNNIIDTNRAFITINPSYGSTIRMNYTQPLLKDFGFRIGRREIIIASNNRQIAEENFQKMIEDIIYNVEVTYWNLVYSRENLKVRQQSLRLAQELLENNKAEVEAGTLPRIELLTAESEVSIRQADILEAEAMVKNYEDQLKTIINLSAEMENIKNIRILPVDSPTIEKRDISYEEALRIAFQKRPDLRALKVDLKNKEFNLRYAKNQLLPDLSFQLSYWSPGISGDQIIYLDNDPYTRIQVGKIPGKKSDALKDALNFKFKNWTAGLVLNLPISSFITRANYAQARLSLDQSMLKLKNQEQQVDLEISTASRAVETNYQRVIAYRAARELAEKKLEAELEKFKVGKSTNYLVLQYQRDLANAQTMEIKAMIDYNISLANLDRAMGTGRERHGVSIISNE